MGVAAPTVPPMQVKLVGHSLVALHGGACAVQAPAPITLWMQGRAVVTDCPPRQALSAARVAVQVESRMQASRGHPRLQMPSVAALALIPTTPVQSEFPDPTSVSFVPSQERK